MNRYTLLAALLLVSTLFTSCATVVKDETSLGTIKENNDVTNSYKSYFINPDFNYFYYGTELQPDAIMGIHEDYDVQSDFWKQIKLSEEQLEYWVVWGDRQGSDAGFSRRYSGYQGAYILDPSGKVIGDWYSKKDMGSFYFPGSRVMIPYPPINQDGSPSKPCE